MPSATDHKVVLISGATSGIGYDLAVRMAQAGDASLVLTGRNADRLAALAQECAGAETLTVAADLGQPGEGARVVAEAVKRFGRIDVLVVSSGLYLGAEFDVSDPSVIDALLQINVGGAMQLVRAAVPSMREAGQGDILLVTSVSGYQDIHWEPVYSASKHAMVSFTHTLRRQLVDTGLRVMSIGPGVVLTELWGYERADERIDDQTGSGRGIEVSQVTDAICFMLDRPRHVTIRDLVILPTNQEI